MKTILKGGLVIKDGKCTKTDVFIDGAFISGRFEDADQVIDCSKKIVMGGLIDMHCHLREPGQEYKEDIESGTKSAAAGGFTAVACMPNTKPAIDIPALVEYVVTTARAKGYTRVYPIAAQTKGQSGQELSEMKLLRERGAVAVSEDGKSLLSSRLMRNVLKYSKTAGLTVISHCEDPELADGGSANEGYNASIAGIKGIPKSSEHVIIARDILLAEECGAAVHIAHVSTKNSVQLIREAKRRGVRVTCETCPHYFTLTDEMILNYDTDAKINPPLREREDVEAIIKGIIDGTIDAIATDHAPHGDDDKKVEFESAAFGTTGFEACLALAYTHLIKTKKIDWQRLCELMSVNPSKILNVPRCGLSIGDIADITVFDPDKEWIIDAKSFSKSSNCVFKGMKADGKTAHTIVNGQLVYSRGNIIGKVYR